MNYEKIWLVVPTYWGDFGTKENPPCIDFDHPTNPKKSETLTKTLENLVSIKGNFNLLIILAVTHKEYLKIANEKVTKIINNLDTNKKIYLIDEDVINNISKFTNKNILKMNSYGNIRNVQLFTPYLLQGEYIIAIDDDEIIEDTNYIEKVVNTFEHNKDVKALAGPYFDKSGEYKIKDAENLKDLDNIFLSKNYYMNKALKNEMNHRDNLHKSVVAFGGNMIFTREIIEKVCHDPFIPRGEDYDYTLNALMYKIRFYFQKNIPITHLPPNSKENQEESNIRKLKADIKRFIYMNFKIIEFNKKFKENKIDLSILNPYPGAFVKDIDELANQGKKALIHEYHNLQKEDEIDNFIKETIEISKTKSKEYFKYREEWIKFIKESSQSQDIINYLKSLVIN